MHTFALHRCTPQHHPWSSKMGNNVGIMRDRTTSMSLLVSNDTKLLGSDSLITAQLQPWKTCDILRGAFFTLQSVKTSMMKEHPLGKHLPQLPASLVTSLLISYGMNPREWIHLLTTSDSPTLESAYSPSGATPSRCSSLLCLVFRPKDQSAHLTQNQTTGDGVTGVNAGERDKKKEEDNSESIEDKHLFSNSGSRKHVIYWLLKLTQLKKNNSTAYTIHLDKEWG